MLLIELKKDIQKIQLSEKGMTNYENEMMHIDGARIRGEALALG